MARFRSRQHLSHQPALRLAIPQRVTKHTTPCVAVHKSHKRTNRYPQAVSLNAGPYLVQTEQATYPLRSGWALRWNKRRSAVQFTLCHEVAMSENPQAATKKARLH